MKSVLLSLAFVALMGVNSLASFVTLDNFNGSSSGTGFLSGFTSVVGGSSSFSATALSVGNGASITYTGTNLLSNYAPNWLLTFDVDALVGSGASVQLTVNGGPTSGALALAAGMNSLNFLNAAIGVVSVTNVRLDFIAAGGFNGAVINQIAATPEPASLLTAGMFSLIGGFAYRRRKAKKTVA